MTEQYFTYNGFEFLRLEDNKARIVRENNIFGESIRYYDKESCINIKNRIINLPNGVYDNQGYLFEVTEIADGFFDNAKHIEEIHIPDSIVKIGWGFWTCSNLRKIYVDKNNPIYTDIEGVLFSKNREKLIFFPNSYSIKYEIPEKTIRLENKAFKDCKIIEEIVCPKSLKHIGVNAFYGCNNLKDVYLPNDIISFDKNIGSHTTQARFHYKRGIYNINNIAEVIKGHKIKNL